MQAKSEVEWEAMGLSFSLCKEPIERPPGRLIAQLEGAVLIWRWRCMSGRTNVSLSCWGEDPTEAEAKVHPIQLI